MLPLRMKARMRAEGPFPTMTVLVSFGSALHGKAMENPMETWDDLHRSRSKRTKEKKEKKRKEGRMNS